MVTVGDEIILRKIVSRKFPLQCVHLLRDTGAEQLNQGTKNPADYQRSVMRRFTSPPDIDFL